MSAAILLGALEREQERWERYLEGWLAMPKPEDYALAFDLLAGDEDFMSALDNDMSAAQGVRVDSAMLMHELYHGVPAGPPEVMCREISDISACMGRILYELKGEAGPFIERALEKLARRDYLGA